MADPDYPRWLGCLLAFAYPDRIAQQRRAGGADYRLANGSAATFGEPDALMKQPWLVIADLGSRQGQREERIYLAADLDPALFEGPLAELAPRTLEVPSGSRIRLDYSDEMPVLAERLQELFGLADTPRIANGRQASSCTCCAGHPGPGELLAQYLRGSEERFTR